MPVPRFDCIDRHEDTMNRKEAARAMFISIIGDYQGKHLERDIKRLKAERAAMEDLLPEDVRRAYDEALESLHWIDLLCYRQFGSLHETLGETAAFIVRSVKIAILDSLNETLYEEEEE